MNYDAKCNALVQLIERSGAQGDVWRSRHATRPSEASSTTENSNRAPCGLPPDEVEDLVLTPEQEYDIAVCIGKLTSTTPQAMNSTYMESDSDFQEQSDGVKE